MNIKRFIVLLILLIILSVVLSSCSSIKQTLSDVYGGLLYESFVFRTEYLEYNNNKYYVFDGIKYDWISSDIDAGTPIIVKAVLDDNTKHDIEVYTARVTMLSETNEIQEYLFLYWNSNFYTDQLNFAVSYD